MSGAIDNVSPNADSRHYWDSALQGKLVFKKCSACGHVQFPPRALCPACWSDKLEWTEHSGSGSVLSFTTVHRAPTPAFVGKVPYVLAMIELEGGPRMMSNIVGEGALEVKLGDCVRVVFEKRGEAALPQFCRVTA